MFVDGNTAKFASKIMRYVYTYGRRVRSGNTRLAIAAVQLDYFYSEYRGEGSPSDDIYLATRLTGDGWAISESGTGYWRRSGDKKRMDADLVMVRLSGELE